MPDSCEPFPRPPISRSASPSEALKADSPGRSVLSFADFLREEGDPRRASKQFSTATTGVNAAEHDGPGSVAPSAARAKPRTGAGCRCGRTKCLKLYCACFASGALCGERCRCADCHNTSVMAEIREIIVRETVEKNPSAFRPKYKTRASTAQVLHARGCACRRTGCLKNYCECFKAGIGCSQLCRCLHCSNGVIELAEAEVPLYYEKVSRKRRKIRSVQDFYLGADSERDAR